MTLSKREKVLLIVLGVLIILFGGYLAYAKYFKKKAATTTNSTQATTQTSQPSVSENKPVETTPAKTKLTPLTDPGVTWLGTPQQLDDLNLFKQASNFDCAVTAKDGVKYYKTATLDDGGEIILATSGCGIGNDYIFRFKKNAAGKYALLVNNTGYEATDGNWSAFLNADVMADPSINTTASFAQITSPDVIADANGIQYKKGIYTPFGGGQIFFSELKNPQEVSDTVYGKIYQVYDGSSTSNEAKITYLYLKHADGTVTGYGIPIPFMSDDSIPNVTINGTANATKYFSSVVLGGCGGLGAVSIVTDTKNMSTRTKQVGTAKNGDKIYGLVNANDPILALAYESYKVGRDASSIMTFEQFAAKNPVFLWQNPLGDWVTFFSQDYAPNAECGKPVVYLYPTEKTNVSVKVDVDMTVSDPLYNGIWNVIANPSGKLTVNGKTYPYLYWEGRGHIYTKPDAGSVVAASDVKNQIVSDLKKQGLTSKETADFLDFWLPKMPKTPYVRLTWLGNTEMNALAPMTVNPRPDTVIRVFLDFQGLDQPTQIAPQSFKTPERKGFTVVEWGGLLSK